MIDIIYSIIEIWIKAILAYSMFALAILIPLLPIIIVGFIVKKLSKKK